MDGRTATVRSGVAHAYAPLRDPTTWRVTLYHLLDLPAAWLAFFLLLAAGGFSVVLAPLALVVLAAVVAVVRRVARIERWRARQLLDLHIDEPAPPPDRDGVLEWATGNLKDTAAWRAVAYLAVRFALGNVAFFVTALSWWVTLAMLTTLVWADSPFTDAPHPGDLYAILDVWWEHALAFGAGLVALAVVPRVTRGIGWLSGRTVTTLLGPGPDAQIRRLEDQRSSAVRIADVDRRRIEQDLHDGAQVQLTALAMQLGLTREALAEGAERDTIATMVDEAHGQAKQALREIRDLARGIHPAILTDRGLDAALASMVGRLPVDVDLEVDVDPRPPAAVESIAYFVAAEALTNAVRHADSQEVGLRVVGDGDQVVVEVRDRGRGGAVADRGTGLANMRQRVESAGGELCVMSPEGVGTLVRAVVPCGS